MGGPKPDSRVRRGLIPVLVAMRVKAERERHEAEATGKNAPPATGKKKKRGWFG